jgi:SH3 domain-containing YSC84-like protein 1
MIRFMTIVVCLALASTRLTAADKALDRLEEAGVVIEEILVIDDNIPQDLLDKAECVIVIPSMLKIALGLGGSYGRGAMVCRTGPGFDGPWGAPAMFRSSAVEPPCRAGGQSAALTFTQGGPVRVARQGATP